MIIAGDGNAYAAYDYADNFAQGQHLRLMRVDSSGAASTVAIADEQAINSSAPGFNFVSMITNADKGVLLTWSVFPLLAVAPGGFGMATSDGSSVSLLNSPTAPGQYAIALALQAEDGSFIGTETYLDANSDAQVNMIAFDLSGNVRWVVPGMCPQIGPTMAPRSHRRIRVVVTVLMFLLRAPWSRSIKTATQRGRP